MKLTRASSYALYAVAYMAQQKNTDVPVASHNIAKARGIPDRFLLKVLKPLVGARVLKSVKGPNGGYELARPASEITLLEIIETIDAPIRGNAPLTKKPNPMLNSKLETICNTCAEAVRKTLQKVRVSDLIAGAKGEDDSKPASRRKARETAS
jgi:Rrf2 family protein